MRRTFPLQRRISEGSGGGFVDIPHMSILRYRTPEQLIDRFTSTWGLPPQAVILPVTSSDGLLFPVEGLGLPMSSFAYTTDSLGDYQEIVQAFSRMGLDIYLLLDPSLHFCRTDTLHLIDIVGDGSAALCINNPRSQELLSALLGTAVDEVIIATADTPGKLKGVVMDTVNLWPMGAENERLELNCFCSSCTSFFNTRNPSLLPSFKNFPNPWNLLLKDSGTGISHFDNVASVNTPDDIVGFSRLKGFDAIFPDRSHSALLGNATRLLEYIQIRHQMTIDSIAEIFSQALDNLQEKLLRIVLTEGASYSWTSGLLLDRLDSSAGLPLDEVWIDHQSTGFFFKHVPFRSYLWRRSRYYIDAFLTFAGNVTDPVARATTGIARLSKRLAEEMLLRRLNQALGTATSEKSALASLPDLRREGGESQRIGFVAVALDREVGEKFIQGLRIPEGLQETTEKLDAGRMADLLQSLEQSRRG